MTRTVVMSSDSFGCILVEGTSCRDVLILGHDSTGGLYVLHIVWFILGS